MDKQSFLSSGTGSLAFISERIFILFG